MAPTPQVYPSMTKDDSPGKVTVPRPLEGDEVVITGMSGVFPNSKSVQEFMDNLYNKVDMVTDEHNRWDFDHPEVPDHLGVISGMDKFDAQFFRVHYKQAVTLEPTCRKILEHAYSAIFDAGINPTEMRGKKVGVFVGASISESEKVVQYETIQIDGFGITGTNKSMFANRISYWMDAKGPSYAIDTACASSMVCLEHAYRSIISGHCEAAIVGGCSLCLQPFIELNMSRVGFLCSDGKTKCFDKHGDGYVRADTVSVLFLQRAKDAKRIYCEVYHAKTAYDLSLGDSYLPIRKPHRIQAFLEQFYKEINVSPQEVEYIEAFAPGIAEADRAELQAIGQLFCKDKQNPLLIGCVKSNMGNSEPASGVCSTTKACLAYQSGVLPANLHYSEPHDFDFIRDGRLQVVTENTPFKRGYVALNSFSYTGANVHVLLKAHYKEKNPKRYQTSIPHLVVVSGRQESCVTNLLQFLHQNPVDPEAIGLLHKIHRKDIAGHTCRGYTIITTDDKNETVSLSQSIEYSSGITRPLWFVYSGMGSQWAGMGKELMRIPVFAAAIENCRKILEPKGVDLLHILTNPDKTIYDNILNSFVGIAAVQIGLTDVLKSLGIVPDNIIGHSVGELGCAYADGCFTAEEMILSAYSRGLVSVQTPFIKGSMAAVGISYKAVLPLLPPEIEVACHNSAESCTISGPADIMKQFVADLTSKGVFAKEVPCSNIAYHSRYITDAGPGLLKYLNEVIKNPRQRSEKWLSTSIPHDKWNDPIAKHSSAEYHTNNLLNSVLFEETSKFIPSNAILIEIAPHGLLQAILKRALPDTCVHVPLTRRGHADPIKFFLEAVGKLYATGLNPQVDVLYPEIEFPVSTETPLLGQLVEWEHSENWSLATFSKKLKVKAASREFVISVHDNDHKYLEDHVREGVNVYPEAAILVRVWETLGLLIGTNYKELPVTFHNVRFHSEAVLRRDVPLILNVAIHKGNQHFEVSYEDVCIASGDIIAQKKFYHRKFDKSIEKNDEKVNLTADDVYRMFRLKGHTYKEKFQTIRSAKPNFTEALLRWDDEWCTFIDSMIQMGTIKRNHIGVSVPNFIQKITIDVKKQYLNNKIRSDDDVICFEADTFDVYSTIRCGGVELFGLSFTDKPLIESNSDVLAKKEFIPHFPIGKLDTATALNVILQVVNDNVVTNDVKVTELVDKPTSICPILKDIADQNVSKNIDVTTVNVNDVINCDVHDEDIAKSNLIIVDNLLRDQQKMVSIYKKIPENQFILTRESEALTISSKYTLFDVVSSIDIHKYKLVLLRKSVTKQDNVVYVEITQDFDDSRLSQIRKQLKNSKNIVLLSEIRPNFGLLGLTKNLREEFKEKVSLLVVEDPDAPTFNPQNVFYKNELEKNLAYNILKKGVWGGYYYLPTRTSVKLQDVSLKSVVPGNLDTLSWIESGPVPVNNNLVQVHYAGITRRDVQKANGTVLTTDICNKNQYGMDFSGINNRGQRVMGIVAEGSISNIVEADPDLLWPVPEHWSLEDAATVPLAYIQAFYCLVIRSEVFHGARVLVHGGAGALGQAAISIALAFNCKVYATVSDAKKKALLLKLFPELQESQIGNSRDDSFEAMVMNETNGEGCDFIISCVSKLLRQATIRCAAVRGKTLDVGHRDMAENDSIGMNCLSKECAYTCVNVSSIFRSEYAELKKDLQQMLSAGIQKGYVRPVTRVTYSPSEVSRAFRLVATSKHRGRVLIRLNNSTVDSGIESLPRLSLNSKSCYVVVCDYQDLGVELADKLISRGVRNIVLHVNADYANGYFYMKLLSWQEKSVNVKLSSENLDSAKGCVNLLHSASELGSVEGIFVAQISEGQNSIRNGTPDDSSQLDNAGSCLLNLDLGSRQLCTNLKYFVVVTSGRDISDKSITEEIALNRTDIGLPTLALQVGPIEELQTNADNVAFGNVKPQKISTIFNTMEASLRLGHNIVAAYNVNKKTSFNFNEKIAKILGVKEIQDVPENLHLEQVVGVDGININEIINLLQNEFNYIYSKDKLEKITIAELKQLPYKLLESQRKQRPSGLDAFIGYVDPDEYLATQPIVPMQTKLSNSCDLVDEIDKQATYLMLIPGYEGHYRIFDKVCDRLKVQAVTLQLEPDFVSETVQETAQRIFKMIKKRFVMGSKFYLLGYSFGVLVALELAALLEKGGQIGTVFCLDSGPDVLRAHLETYLGSLTPRQLQISIIEHMYKLMNGTDLKELREDLERLEEWPQRVEACMKRLRAVVSYSNQYKRSVIENAYKRINQALNYEPSFKILQSQLVLLRAEETGANLSADYGLSKLSQHRVKVYDLDTDHASAPQDLRCSNIINSALDPDVLEEFQQNFTCDIYCADQENMF